VARFKLYTVEEPPPEVAVEEVAKTTPRTPPKVWFQRGLRVIHMPPHVLLASFTCSCAWPQSSFLKKLMRESSWLVLTNSHAVSFLQGTAKPPAKGKGGKAEVDERPALNPAYKERSRWVLPAHGTADLVVLFQVQKRASLGCLSTTSDATATGDTEA
jgi:hypothetical protein